MVVLAGKGTSSQQIQKSIEIVGTLQVKQIEEYFEKLRRAGFEDRIEKSRFRELLAAASLSGKDPELPSQKPPDSESCSEGCRSGRISEVRDAGVRAGGRRTGEPGTFHHSVISQHVRRPRVIGAGNSRFSHFLRRPSLALISKSIRHPEEGLVQNASKLCIRRQVCQRQIHA
jgi:hypothetical protein